ncbi:HVO_2922 family protein [Halalkalicoccus subterraneus]|uniref:HVO_2922 family protein n=1 Tax=Halalkalicoccus subterraneus TaxID=2675002 RepID=UPI000EFC05A0|nr:HVO_2922 family protein [Halalkalicoccus subterraneus]
MVEDTLFEFESDRSREEIAAYLRALAAEFDTDGPVTFRDGEYALAVTPPASAAFDVEVEREDGDGGSELEIELEIEWSENGTESSAERVESLDPDVGIQFTPESDDGEPSQGRFEVYRDRADEWRWRLVHRNGNIIADGGEGYSSKQSAIKGLRSVQHNAPGARIEDVE